VKITVNITDKSVYEKLVKMAEMVNIPVEKLVKRVIKGVALQGDFVVKEFLIKNPIRVRGKMERLEVAFSIAVEYGMRFYWFFLEPFLKRLDAFGHYYVDDMDVDYEGNVICFHFALLRGSPLRIHTFFLDLEGLSGGVSITTYTYLNEGTPKEILDRMDELSGSIEDEIINHEDFQALESIRLEVNKGEKMIIFEAYAEEHDDLPPIPELSNFIRKLLVKSGYQKWEKTYNAEKE